VRGRAVACLYAARQGAAKVFGDEARRIADFLATLTGAALENAVGFEEAARLSAALEQRAAEVRRLGEALARSQEEERRQVALTLHDGVGQSLVALSMRVHAMRGGERDERRARALDEVVALVEHLCQEMRRISHDLRPSVLDIFGLPEALRDVAESLSTEARPVALEVEPPELGALPDEVAVTLFRVAQSALANAALHADAGRITVRLAGTADHVRLDVEDDGVGFDPAEAARRGGIGLIGMRERVAWLGGRFDVASAPGAGTRVRVELPLDAAGR
jgi:signal transduction histidine kinase